MDNKHNSIHNFHTFTRRSKDPLLSNDFIDSNSNGAIEEEEDKYPDICELEYEEKEKITNDELTSNSTTSLVGNSQWAFEVLYNPNPDHFGHFYISLIYSTQDSNGNWQDHTILSLGKKDFFYVSSKNCEKRLSVLELEKDLPSNQSSGGYKIYTQEHYPLESKNVGKIFFWLEKQLFYQQRKCRELLKTNNDLFFKFLKQLKGIDDDLINIDELLDFYKKTSQSAKLNR